MHINGKQMNLNSVNPYAAAAEKATAAQRTGNGRRKLKKTGGHTESMSSPNQVFLLGKWMAPRRGQTPGDLEYHTETAGKNPDFG